MADVRKQAVNINDILELVMTDLRPLAEKNHLELRAELASEPLILMGDADMIYRVYSNLVSNAIKFTPDGGSVTVVSHSQGNDLCIEVRDTGIGIEPEALGKIFDAFYQLTPSSVGIGVGLTISKKIVLMHEGQIWAESEGPGKGTTVKTVFPLFRNPV
jgi:signal transduction histidine kinase